MRVQIKMTLNKETPGALRFHEVVNGNIVSQPNAPGAKIGVLYVRKTAFPNGIPSDITVTIEDGTPI